MIHPESDCKRCGLCSNRTNIVLPSGDYDSPVIFVGEGPGENEDLRGIPFVGKAGQILDDVFQKAGLPREKVLISNTVKCRPPGNRDPLPDEMAACRPFLDSEMENRKAVVGLGKSAIKDLLGYEGPMKDIVNTRQKIIVNGKEIVFIPTYHPMACIYNKQARQILLDTMISIREEYF